MDPEEELRLLRRGRIRRARRAKMTDTAMARFADSFRYETIKIYVGAKTQDAEPYIVPKTVLCKYRYFRTALSLPFVEGQTGILHFPEDTDESWSILIYWLFKGKVEWSEMEDGNVRAEENLLNLTRAYVLGDKYGLPKFQNQIARAMMRGVDYEDCIPTDSIEEALKLMPSKSPLRWIILEKIVLMVKSEWACREWSEFAGLAKTPEMFADLMACFEEYMLDEDGDKFPLHDSEDVDEAEFKKRYFVDEPKEDEEYDFVRYTIGGG